MEDLQSDNPTERCNGDISLATEIQEVVAKQDSSHNMPSVTELLPQSTQEFKDVILEHSNDDDTDHQSNFLTAHNLLIMFTFTTLTILPSILSTTEDTSWEEIFKSAMDPFLIPNTSMPPI